jgi:hypothetical protein
LDETSFNFHMRDGKTWQSAENSVKFPLSNKRLSGVTVIGAIGYNCDGLVYKIAKSTCKEEFKEFLFMLTSKIDSENTKPYLCLDNHVAHKAVMCKAIID